MKTIDMYKKGSSVVGEGELIRIELEMTEKEYAEFQQAYCPECHNFLGHKKYCSNCSQHGQ